MPNKECNWSKTPVQGLKSLVNITGILQRIHTKFQPVINLENNRILNSVVNKKQSFIILILQWNPALRTLVNTDTCLLWTVLFVPTTHIFSYISQLTRIIRTLFHIPLVSVLTGFHCIVELPRHRYPYLGQVQVYTYRSLKISSQPCAFTV